MQYPYSNYYGFGYIENHVPSQDGSNSYYPPYYTPPCSPEYSGYGQLGKDDSSESKPNEPPIARPPNLTKDDKSFPGDRPGPQNTDQNVNEDDAGKTGEISGKDDSNKTIDQNKNENTIKAVVIGGAVLLSIVGIFAFGRGSK